MWRLGLTLESTWTLRARRVKSGEKVSLRRCQQKQEPASVLFAHATHSSELAEICAARRRDSLLDYRTGSGGQRGRDSSGAWARRGNACSAPPFAGQLLASRKPCRRPKVTRATREQLQQGRGHTSLPLLAQATSKSPPRTDRCAGCFEEDADMQLLILDPSPTGRLRAPLSFRRARTCSSCTTPVLRGRREATRRFLAAVPSPNPRAPRFQRPNSPSRRCERLQWAQEEHEGWGSEEEAQEAAQVVAEAEGSS